jgi:hypothetical protein
MCSVCSEENAVTIMFLSDIFQALIQISRKYESTFWIWEGQLFVYVQDIKHIVVSCFLGLVSLAYLQKI